MSIGERVSWVLVVLGTGTATAPFAAPSLMEPLGDGRIALLFVGAVVGLSAFICTFVFRSRNRGRAWLLAGQELRVPIPAGKEAEAIALAQKLAPVA